MRSEANRLLRLTCLTVAAAALFCWLAAAGASAARSPEYLRIRFDSGDAVYVQFQEKEMRVAATAAGLARAVPVKATESNESPMEREGVYYRHQFPDVGLPVAADDLPAGFSGARVTLSYSYFEASGGARRSRARDSAFAYGNVGLSREDGRGAVWTYWVGRGSDLGSTPEQAPMLTVPSIGRLVLQIDTKVEKNRAVRIAVLAKSGELQLSDVTKDGKSCQVDLEVSAKDGKVVASKEGALSELGYT